MQQITNLEGNLSSQINPFNPLTAQGWFMIAQAKGGAPKQGLDAKASRIRTSASEACSASPSYFHYVFCDS